MSASRLDVPEQEAPRASPRPGWTRSRRSGPRATPERRDTRPVAYTCSTLPWAVKADAPAAIASHNANTATAKIAPARARARRHSRAQLRGWSRRWSPSRQSLDRSDRAVEPARRHPSERPVPGVRANCREQLISGRSAAAGGRSRAIRGLRCPAVCRPCSSSQSDRRSTPRGRCCRRARRGWRCASGRRIPGTPVGWPGDRCPLPRVVRVSASVCLNPRASGTNGSSSSAPRRRAPRSTSKAPESLQVRGVGGVGDVEVPGEAGAGLNDHGPADHHEVHFSLRQPPEQPAEGELEEDCPRLRAPASDRARIPAYISSMPRMRSAGVSSS